MPVLAADAGGEGWASEDDLLAGSKLDGGCQKAGPGCSAL
jgi:hypothetical protein